jgi:conjugal transfer/type IV secretion protein DotA/TraY
MAITKKQVLKTVLLPGIIPRMRELFSPSFGFLAYLIVIVFNIVRILPNNHPYLKPHSAGTYSIRQAIAEAANNIAFKKKNIDQIIIFFSIIASLIILVIQFVLLVVAMMIPKANAALPTTVEGFFKTPNPEEDLAYRLLDLVFGVPDFFNSKEEVNTALHQALHKLFEFYSFGIVIVGAMIIVYLVVAIVSETAVSGTPFGQRFNKAWAPIRVVLFFGLLVPISNGLNGGQYLTLLSAKLGSGLASTGWVAFNDKIAEENETLTGKKEQNVAKVKAADLSHLPAFMLVAKTCQKSYNFLYNDKTYPASWDPQGDETGVKAWAVYKVPPDANASDPQVAYKAEKMESKTISVLKKDSKGNDIHIVFGVKDPETYKNFRGGVAPVCGTMVFKVTDVAEPGSEHIQNAYYDLVKSMWQGARELDKYAMNYVKRYVADPSDPTAELPTKKYIVDWLTYLKEHMGDEKDGVIAEAIKIQIEQGKWQMPPEMKDYGWAGAGIWYNKIAQQNGALVSAIRQTPVTVLYPRAMEAVRSQKEREDKSPDVREQFRYNFSAEAEDAQFLIDHEKDVAQALNHPYEFWEGNKEKPEEEKTGNAIIDTINSILGTHGLFEICKNTEVHPLAQLSALGKSLLDNSIQSFMASVGVGLLSLIPSHFSVALKAGSSFFVTIATIGLSIGFILFYVLPFFPFLYFFFAVAGWLKTIFEAMVAMPLWALAHLRIDGEGMPGDAAIGGYYLLFEIFIRPLLIVVGLLAAVAVFAAMVKVLNEVFYLVISNLSGNDPRSSTVCFQNPSAPKTGPGSSVTEADIKSAFRGPVDEFFFTVMYTIIVFLIGQSCFKLIDLIPKDILRWLNAEVPSLTDDAEDPAKGMLMYMTLAGQQVSGGLDSIMGKKG